MNHAQFWGGAAAAPYEIEQSLRFNSADNAYLAESSIGVTTTCTISWWHKKAAGSTSNTHWYIGSYPSGWTFESTDSASNGWTCLNGGGSLPGPSGSKYRDYSAWHHWVFTQNGTTSTMWLNGVKVKEDTSNSGSSKTGWRIGEDSSGANDLNGYMAEFIFLDGTAVSDPDGVLGEFDDNGVWRPIEYTGGNYGTDGFYLKFDPSATNGIGHDHSGNGNNFTPSAGFTTSGTGTDVMSDTPTNNFATLNAAYTPNDMSFADGNLYFAPTTSGWRSAQSTIGVTGSGKYYCEMKLSSINQARIALTSIQDTDLFNTGSTTYSQNGVIVDADGNQITSGASWTSGDVMALAIDMDNGSVAYYKNGSLQQTVTGLDTSKHWRPGVIAYTSSTNGYFNFGQRAWEYTPPTGFDNAICTANLPTPTVKDGSANFNTMTYTGNGSTQTIPNVGFQPDFVWVKNRDQTVNHVLFDAVRGFGSGKELASDVSNVEGGLSSNLYGYVSGVNSTSNGNFSVAAGTSGANYVNVNSIDYAAWNWLAGNGTTTPTQGTIASTASVNQAAGFSIVSYTGKSYTGTASTDTGTVGHGLGVPPAFIMIKSRGSSSSWICYHKELGNLKYLTLDTTDAANTNSSYQPWASTSPTNTVFTVGPYFPTYINDNKATIAYCFAEIEGYSKFGSYTANYNSDGPFVYTGFAPQFLIIKQSDGGNNWVMLDTKRVTSNPRNRFMSPDNANGENTPPASETDFLSNGFKIRTTWSGLNYPSGGTFVYMAFASNPFGGDGVSPATAQ